MGVEVTLAALPGTQCPWARVVYPDFRQSIEAQIPDVDLFQYFNTPRLTPTRPYAVNIGGNGKPGERFARNTIFVSHNHAQRHGAQCFVHNGIDPDEYVFDSRKQSSLLFLAKASWRVKNVRGAMRIARAAGRPLDIVGGSRWWCPRWRGVSWRGMLGGERKARYLAQSSGLLFPVLWHEPFGLAVIEALVSGTPVLASPWGSLPELIDPAVGRLCHTEQEFIDAVPSLGEFAPARCREWVLEQFTHQKMASGYLRLYERVLNREWLNAQEPVTQAPEPGLLDLPRR